MQPLRIPKMLIDRVLRTIVACGKGEHECVVYVTAPLDNGHRASNFLHPVHTATTTSTEVSGEQLDQVWQELHERHERLVLQVHSHPGAAHHSGIDDRWPVLHRVGFPSLVIARFGRDGLAGAYLAVYLGNGDWEDIGETWSEHLVIEHGVSP